jgi:hypothetical protein
VRIPHLKEKIDLLFRYHPSIRRQDQLAIAMRIGPSGLQGGLRPDTVSRRDFSALVDIFGVPAAVLESEDLAELKRAFVPEAGRSAWNRLAGVLSDDEAIEFVVHDGERIIDPERDADHGGILRVYADQQIMVRVENPGFGHGVLLQQDRNGWHPLWPNLESKETEVKDALVFPRQSPGGTPRFAPLIDSSVHSVLAIFTQQPLPSDVVNAFMGNTLDVIDDHDLDRAASILIKLIIAGKAKLLSRRFLLTNVPRQ